MNNKTKLNQQAASWETYWQGDQSSHAYSSAGVNHEDVSGYWSVLFKEFANKGQRLKMLDIASGNGALPELALSQFSNDLLEVTALDISPAAVKNLTDRFPQVRGIVSDALNIPLPPAEFDLVTSQFGLEYAGLEAIKPALNLVASGGSIVLMMHIEGGLIHSNCQANSEALSVIDESQFIALAYSMFEYGFKAVAGEDRMAYDQAANALAPALTQVETVLEEYGTDIAGGSILKLYSDIGSIHSKLPNYSADDVLPWLKTMQSEMTTYAERMATMLNAAVSLLEFDGVCDSLTGAGFSLQNNSALIDQHTQQLLAWVLRAHKQ